MGDAQCLEFGRVRRGGIPPHVVPAFTQVDGQPGEGIEVPIHGGWSANACKKRCTDVLQWQLFGE